MKSNFNDFRFSGLDWRQCSNKYITMDRVSADENKIVVRVSSSHLFATKYGWALILDRTHVVFLKEWQVGGGSYGIEVLLNREFFNVKEFGEHSDFTDDEDNLKFDTWLATAKEQDSLLDEEGGRINPVRWDKKL